MAPVITQSITRNGPIRTRICTCPYGDYRKFHVKESLMSLKVSSSGILLQNEVSGYFEYRVKRLNYSDRRVPDTYTTIISYGNTHVCSTGASNVD